MNKFISAVLLAVVLAFGIWLRLSNPTPAAKSPDETYYLYYAQRVLAEPLDAPRELVSQYISEPQRWEYPIPLRIGCYYPIALVAKLWHVTPVKAGLAVSTTASIVQLLLVAFLALRFFGPAVALAAAALLSVCPQDLMIAARVWTDGPAGAAAMVFVWLCAEIAVRPRAKLWFAALWIWTVYFLLIKESGGFFFGFCLLGLAVNSWRRDRSWKGAAWILAGGVIAAWCAFVLMAVLCGGIPAVFQCVHDDTITVPHNLYALNNQQGPWYSFPLAFWILSPLTAAGCAVALAATAVPGNSLSRTLSLDQRQRNISVGLAALIVLVILSASIPFGLKNVRYASMITGPWYLMAALGLTYTIARLNHRFGARAKRPIVAAAVIVVLLSCWSDYSRYRDVFVRRQTPDLDIRDIVNSPLGLRS